MSPSTAIARNEGTGAWSFSTRTDILHVSSINVPDLDGGSSGDGGPENPRLRKERRRLTTARRKTRRYEYTPLRSYPAEILEVGYLIRARAPLLWELVLEDALGNAATADAERDCDRQA